jgi:metallo-beta-lactamase class B
MLFPRRGPAESLRAEAFELGRRRLLGLGCACCLASALPLTRAAAQAAAENPEVQRHLAVAREAAGTDLQAYLSLAQIAAPTPGARRASPDELMRMPTPPPGRAFDNLIFVGNHWVSAWAIPTSDGIILIDAMDNDDEAERIVAAGLRRVGFDPAAVKLVVITHGHGDHYGGVGFFQRTYGTRPVASGADWTMMAASLEFDRPDWGRPPQRDITVEDGGTVRLGDTTLDVVLTPGHTMGTISLLFDVKQRGRTHRAMLWGGTAFNFGRQPDRIARLQAYIDATAKARETAARQNVEVFVSNHDGYDNAVEKLAAMPGAAANPFVIGTDATRRALTVMHECARATMVVWNS